MLIDQADEIYGDGAAVQRGAHAVGGATGARAKILTLDRASIRTPARRDFHGAPWD
jgi:hypothetical protein